MLQFPTYLSSGIHCSATRKIATKVNFIRNTKFVSHVFTIHCKKSKVFTEKNCLKEIVFYFFIEFCNFYNKIPYVLYKKNCFTEELQISSVTCYPLVPKLTAFSVSLRDILLLFNTALQHLILQSTVKICKNILKLLKKKEYMSFGGLLVLSPQTIYPISRATNKHIA